MLARDSRYGADMDLRTVFFGVVIGLAVGLPLWIATDMAIFLFGGLAAGVGLSLALTWSPEDHDRGDR